MPSSPRSPAAPASEPRRVLVLDDNDAIARLIAHVLTPRGWQVVRVPDGLRAFEQLDALPFQAVIADELLPAGPGGAKVLERVHRIHPGVKLAWLSGYSPSDATLATLHRIGATVLRKGEALLDDIIEAVEGPPNAT